MSDTRNPEEIDHDFFAVDSDRVVYPPGFNPYRETLRIVDRMLDLLDRVIDENGVGQTPDTTSKRAS